MLHVIPSPLQLIYLTLTSPTHLPHPNLSKSSTSHLTLSPSYTSYPTSSPLLYLPLLYLTPLPLPLFRHTPYPLLYHTPHPLPLLHLVPHPPREPRQDRGGSTMRQGKQFGWMRVAQILFIFSAVWARVVCRPGVGLAGLLGFCIYSGRAIFR
jgi:hypothetical protein